MGGRAQRLVATVEDLCNTVGPETNRHACQGHLFKGRPAAVFEHAGQQKPDGIGADVDRCEFELVKHFLPSFLRMVVHWFELRGREQALERNPFHSFPSPLEPRYDGQLTLRLSGAT